MFTQLGVTASTLSRASNLVFRIGTDAHLYDDPDDVSIPPLLDSKYDSEKCEALKRLLALIAQGLDVSEFFPQVVKNVASHSLEVKKLVYLYLLHYAEKRPNEALLCINSFQKDLGDPNPLVRAWALRTMAGMRLHVIAPIVLVAVGKCARDPSVYVRKCAANALPKLHDLQLDTLSPTIEEIVGILLNDYSPAVVGVAAAAFASICPTNYSLIGKSYGKLCEILPDVEEWGQIFLIGILLRYTIQQHGLVKESIMSSLQNEKDVVYGKNCADIINKFGGSSEILYSDLAGLVARCYIERPDEYLSRSSFNINVDSDFSSAKFTSGISNDDVRLLLLCTSPLLWSQSSAVVLASVGVHWIMSPLANVGRIVKPLLFLLRSSDAFKYVVLCNIRVFAKAMPSLFAHYFEDFFVMTSDSYQVKGLKLEILSSIMKDTTVASIFQEFKDYIRDPDRKFAADTVAAIGLCAQQFPKMTALCMEELLILARHGFSSAECPADEEEVLLIQVMIAVKMIIKENPSHHEKVLVQLIRSLDSFKVPASRAVIIWLMGEYCNLGDTIPRMVSVVLRYLAQNFVSESSETKLQIINCLGKVLISRNGEDLRTLNQVARFVFELAECDLNFDIRDRARFLRELLSNYLISHELEEDGDVDLLHSLVECMFLKQVPQLSLEPVDYRTYLPGSLSQIVLHPAPGYEPLPKPCASENEIAQSSASREKRAETDESGSQSGSFDDESSSYCSSNDLNSDTNLSLDEEDTDYDSGKNALIEISDADKESETVIGDLPSASDGICQSLLQTSLESWLSEPPGTSAENSGERQLCQQSSATILIRDLDARVTPKIFILLDSTSGNGLKVNYSFASDDSNFSPHLTGVVIDFENCSATTMLGIKLVEDNLFQSSDSVECALDNEVPVLVPMEEINSIEPGVVMKKIVHVHFRHHLLPVKLSLQCNGKSFPVKLWPDIGYFVRPLPLDYSAFVIQESSLRGIFEFTRSCTFKGHLVELNDENGDSKDKLLVVCDNLAGNILSNANLFLVCVNVPVGAKFDDASGLCLRFSSEVLRNPVPCLISITAEGKCVEPLNVTVKVNCEETVFGLNFLNRIINVLSCGPLASC